MSSDTIGKHGLDRTSIDAAKNPPEAYTVVDVDISAERLRALYAKEPLALAAIDAALQERRNSKAFSGGKCTIPAHMKASFYGRGLIEPVVYTPIGPGSDKVSRNLMIAGSMRTLGMRDANARRKVDGLPPHPFRAFPKAFSIDPEERRRQILDLKIDANMRVPMSITARAAQAAELVSAGNEPADIVGRVEGTTNVPEVQALADLGAVIPQLGAKTLDAVDAGTITIATAIKRAGLSKEEQDKALLPRGERPKQPRPANGARHPLAPKAIEKVAAAIAEIPLSHISAAERAVFRFFAGDTGALADMSDAAANAVLLAGWDKDRGAFPPGRKPAKAGE